MIYVLIEARLGRWGGYRGRSAGQPTATINLGSTTPIREHHIGTSRKIPLGFAYIFAKGFIKGQPTAAINSGSTTPIREHHIGPLAI